MQSTALARLVWWALPVALADALIVWAHGAPFGGSIALGLFGGLCAYVSLLEDQSEAIDHDKPIEDSAAMAQIMLMRAAAIALPVVGFAPLMMLLPLFGAMAGPLTWLCWRYLDGIDSGIYVRGSRFAKGGGEWAEIIACGAPIGAGMAILSIL